MTKIKLTLTGFDDAKKKDGTPYYKFHTSEGDMACFDPKLGILLRSFINQEVEVDIQTKGDFKNIVDLFEGVGEIPQEATMNKISEAPKTNDEFNPTTMYVSYAKDIFIVMVQLGQIKDSQIQAMDSAIDLVKQAREAFE